MKVLAYVNLPFDIDLRKEKAYISLKDGYYVQKVKLMPMPDKKIVLQEINKTFSSSDESEYNKGWNDCIDAITGETE